jgi:hypothetical protein
MLGGGGLVAANVYASATESGAPRQEAAGTRGAVTIDCPDVGDRLGDVPGAARAGVDRHLADLDEQVAQAYRQLQESAAQPDGDAADTVVGPLQEQRAVTIEKIAAAVDAVGERPRALDTLVACTLRTTTGGGTGGDAPEGQQQGNGPVADDYADITAVQPAAPAPEPGPGGSRGTFTTSCGVNEQGLFNSDNVIVAPGVGNGAHHVHDYVGNQSNSAFASDDDLADAGTSCADPGDRSSYYWPVLRLRNGTREADADAPGGGTEGNSGEIVTPAAVTLTFTGHPRDKVTAMPRLLRIITGDAKAFVNGTANANASWSCTGFEDRQLKDKYPLCPDGSDVVRTFRFQSCWDGRNTDSADHRTHVAFAAPDGTCPAGFRPVPQLVQRIVYDVDRPSLDDGGRSTPLFAVDSFPEQLHKPVTDHGDFINVFDDGLMREMVDCINSGRRCGATTAPGTGAGEGPQEQPAATETPGEPTRTPEGRPDPAPAVSRAPTARPSPGDGTGAHPSPGTPATGASASGGPQVHATGSPTAASTHRGPDASAESRVSAAAAPAATPQRTSPAQPVSDARTPVPSAAGGLADTGARLWPAAVGAVLAVAGFVLLRSTRRRAL